jgi:hypothetical protein
MTAVCLGGNFAVVAIFLFGLILVCLLLETEVIIIFFDVFLSVFVACVLCDFVGDFSFVSHGKA